MCRSVPQIEAARTRTSASVGPIAGTATDSSSAPRCGRTLRRAFIVAAGMLSAADYLPSNVSTRCGDAKTCAVASERRGKTRGASLLDLENADGFEGAQILDDVSERDRPVLGRDGVANVLSVPLAVGEVQSLVRIVLATAAQSLIAKNLKGSGSICSVMIDEVVVAEHGQRSLRFSGASENEQPISRRRFPYAAPPFQGITNLFAIDPLPVRDESLDRTHQLSFI